MGRSKKEELLLGTLDMLILRTLVLGPAHGHTIAYVIEHTSEEVLQIEQGSLYPALHRLERQGWLASEWRTSEAHRQAKYYSLTPAGKKQISALDELVKNISSTMTDSLSKTELEALAKIFAKMKTPLGEITEGQTVVEED